MSGYHKRNWETFPMHKIRRVDRPTTLIRDNEVQRVREREAGFCKAAAGDYGPVLQREFRRFVPKHPLSGVQRLPPIPCTNHHVEIEPNCQCLHRFIWCPAWDQQANAQFRVLLMKSLTY